MKKILFSLLTIGVVSTAAYIGITRAFFSDVETSTGNILQAGAIDLKIDNTSYYTNNLGALVASTQTSWTLTDLTVEKFFNFTDLKPGDVGEDTISVHVNNNDAWACARVDITENSENGITEPEADLNDTEATGELAQELNFAFWADDGDNVFEDNETIFVQGPASTVLNGATLALAQPGGGLFGSDPLTGAETHYIGKYYCYGSLEEAPMPEGTSNPVDRGGTGFTCNGSAVGNLSQSDRLVGDISFYAEQSRNNPQFNCESVEWPEPEAAKIGAALASYVQPSGQSCAVTVTNGGTEPNTIAEGIAAATSGDTVCVDPGTYTEDVNVNKSITLSGDGASATSTINGVGLGEAGALVISADDVTVEGFNVIGTGVSAIRISGARNNVTIRHNKAVAASGKNALLMDGGQSNHTVFNNIFEGASSQLVYVNGLASVSVASTNVDFLNNTFRGSGNMALGQEAGASDIKMNVFSTVTSFTDVEDWEGGNAYNQNNFNDTGLNLQHSENVPTGDNGITNAENNWWGDIDPSDGDVNPNVDVDFTPSAAVAYPEN